MRASRTWVEGSRIRYDDPPFPLSKAQALDIYMRSLNSWSNAAQESSRLLAQYNGQLARLEEAKGTLLRANNIVVQDDPSTAIRFRDSYVRTGNSVMEDVSHD